MFLFSTASRPARGPTCTAGIGGSIPGVKRPGREANRSFSSSAEVKNGGAILPLPQYGVLK
jgi:hypothetical protein